MAIILLPCVCFRSFVLCNVFNLLSINNLDVLSTIVQNAEFILKFTANYVLTFAKLQKKNTSEY
jgi:hypothetical protein